MSTETLHKPWIIINGEFCDYACEDHARQYATENGIPASEYGDAYTLTRDGYGTVSDVYPLPSYDSGETDYPASCMDYDCGRYLSVPLTREGRDYMRENGFPAWLYEAYGVTYA